MFSKRTRYALRLLFHLNHNGTRGYRTVEELSRGTDIPTPYLGKIVGALAEMGYLETKKGPSGGARLAMDSEDLLIDDLLLRLGEYAPAEGPEDANGFGPDGDEPDKRLMDHCISGFRERVLNSMTLRDAADLLGEDGSRSPREVAS